MKYLKDPKTGKESVTMTLFITTFGVALLKLLTSGMVIYGVKTGTFSGSDFALVVGSIGGLYSFRKFTDISK